MSGACSREEPRPADGEVDPAGGGAASRPAGVTTTFSAVRVIDPRFLEPGGGQTDNSACLVCHVDLEAEEIAAKHLAAGVICAHCHGASEAHRSDELNITRPDVTYGRAEMVAFCKRCHPLHQKGEKYDQFLQEWQGRRRPNGRTVSADSVCTDCHGQHTILRPDQLPPESP